MQYLSKAYNYYSGINPATLSGAIDVIVVRSVDADGNVFLASSPFHVRFGKLQVLRAGEKRVTIKLPNNLPSPHIAPFSMKVGESGEAFFVLETDEDVPPDLLTSPVVIPSVPDLPTEDIDHQSPVSKHPQTFTKTPFGETERSAKGDLVDVDYFDLNGGNQAQSRMQALGSDSGEFTPPSLSISDPQEANHGSQAVQYNSQPPNPLQVDPGERAGLPERNHKLEHIAAGETTDVSLPRIAAGQGEGPDVIYGKDLVLDMGGYHQTDQHDDASSESYDMFLQDLWRTSRSLRPTLKSYHLSDTVLNGVSEPQIGPSASVSSTPDLSAPISKLEIDSDDDDDDDEEIDSERRMRGQSEPPLHDPHQSLSGMASVSPPRSTGAFAGSVGLGTAASHAAMDRAWDWTQKGDHGGNAPGCFRIVEDNPHLFVLDAGEGRLHHFELVLGDEISKACFGEIKLKNQDMNNPANRITVQAFMTDASINENPDLTILYNGRSWKKDRAPDLFQALSALYSRLNVPVTTTGSSADDSMIQPSNSSWSRWWRRANQTPPIALPPPNGPIDVAIKETSAPTVRDSPAPKHFAKTLRLSSEQLKQLNLKPGPNTINFSVTSSYSGFATCSARVFLWEESDQIVISDIDGTITKSDALGHVFAAIGRDWTHLGIAKLYTDISNNGYRMLYLTSRAIGQADSTREYLRTINQGSYRMPEGPVIMSPDRLMASLHREVIMRKPELFKMACLRDIQRLFNSSAREAFFAGFGNRITDAMSYRSVGIDASKIYTIDSTGVVKTELLQAAGHKGSYFSLNDLVNEVFPPVETKFKPEFTDFSYWRSSIPDVPLPNLLPPSPALSARSDSSRISTGMLSKIATLGRRSSKPILPTSQPSTRPSSPLMAPAFTPDDLSDLDMDTRSRKSSMPGSYEEPKGGSFPETIRNDRDESDLEEGFDSRQDSFDDSTLFDDDLLATGEMQHVPF